MRDQADHEQNQKDEKQDFRDAGCSERNYSKPKNAGHQCDHKKY